MARKDDLLRIREENGQFHMNRPGVGTSTVNTQEEAKDVVSSLLEIISQHKISSCNSQKVSVFRNAIQFKSKLLAKLQNEIDSLEQDLAAFPQRAETTSEMHWRQYLADTAVKLITPTLPPSDTYCKEVSIALWKDRDESGEVGDSIEDYGLAMEFARRDKDDEPQREG